MAEIDVAADPPLGPQPFDGGVHVGPAGSLRVIFHTVAAQAPSSASYSTNRTRSACREMECFW